MDVEVNFILLNKLRKDQNKTFADMEKRTTVPEGTIKNILLGKTKKPGADALHKICDDLGIAVEDAFIIPNSEQLKTQLETQAIKEGNVTVVALKEIYEEQIANLNILNETHINNIRTHYEQHNKDLKENFEKRLSDKREIIESYKEHIATIKHNFLICKVALAVCLIVFIGVLIAELANPELGWFRY